MTPNTRYRANDAECAAKVIDGEAVIINLLNGTYYGLDKSGGAMWEHLANGHSRDEIIAAVVARYEVDAARVGTDLDRLINDLLTEKLLVAASNVEPAALVAPNNGARESYDAPEMTTYRDMADLLALDPPMPRLEDIVWSDSANGKTGPA